MAIRKDVDYPGRWSAATTEYPMGKPKNRTTSTSKDGSYLEKKWIQDYEAFFGAILNDVGETPNGTVDTAESSQFFNALTSKVNGEASFSANGYHKAPGGLILQWGSFTAIDTGSAVAFSQSLPIANPTETLIVMVNPNRGITSQGAVATAESYTNSGFTGLTNGPAQSRIYSYIAIGY